jgi:hypothetical protein
MAETVRLVRKNSTATRVSMGDFPAIDLSESDRADVDIRLAMHLADGDNFIVENEIGVQFDTVPAMLAADSE